MPFFFFSQFKVTLQSLLYSFELWYGTLKKIEGHFGSVTALYFKFLRWLFITNILFSLPIFIFVVIPQIIYSYYEPSSEGKYLIPKQNASVNNTQFSFVDIFTAEVISTVFYSFKFVFVKEFFSSGLLHEFSTVLWFLHKYDNINCQ